MKNRNQSRREFLMSLPPAVLALYSLGGFVPRLAFGAAPAVTNKFILHTNLDGGPDMRHIFPPLPNATDGTPGNLYWKHRGGIFGAGSDFNAWMAAFNANYTPVTANGVTFGIPLKAPWLKRQWDLGRIAIVANLHTSSSRDHAYGSMQMQTGYSNLSGVDIDREGWGGRLVKALGGNVVGLHGATQFCYAPDAANPTGHTLERVIAIEDARKLGFYKAQNRVRNRLDGQMDSVMDRALESYYAAKKSGVSKEQQVMLDYEKAIRFYSAQMDSRLATISRPALIQNLSLADGNFANEIRNLYDSLHCTDILNLRAASVYFGGWDTHENQLVRIDSLLTDLFGDAKAFDSLLQSLEANHPTAAEQMTVVFGGEFGRKLHANGAKGTDHGMANCMVLFGKNVRGGVYGELFPVSETVGGIDNHFGYANGGGEIKGRTNMEHLYAAIANNMLAGAGTIVSPGASALPIEVAGLFSSLFRS